MASRMKPEKFDDMGGRYLLWVTVFIDLAKKTRRDKVKKQACRNKNCEAARFY